MRRVRSDWLPETPAVSTGSSGTSPSTAATCWGPWANRESSAAATSPATAPDPVTGDGEGVVPLDALVAAIESAQARIVDTLGQTTAADLSRPAPGHETNSVAERIASLIWHETYHLGQTEYLRQLAGTNDKVI